MKVEYNKTYHFTVSAAFGDIPQEKVNELFQDGRRASHFLEIQLEYWFPELTFVNAKGYDHVRKNSDKLYDAKCFTKGGLTYAPSVMLGAGRKVVKEDAHEHAKSIDYIACDVVDFPHVRVRFVSGNDMVEQYPSTRIPFKDREVFFAD